MKHSMIRVDFYKPSGKWYAGGIVDMEDVPTWASNKEILAQIAKAQTILQSFQKDRAYWTIVTNDTPENYADESYQTCWKRIVQVGKNESPF